MRKSPYLSLSGVACWTLGLAVLAGMPSGCSEEGGSSPSQDAGAAGEVGALAGAPGVGGAPGAGGASAAQAGAPELAGMSNAAGAATLGEAGSAGMASGGAPTGGGDCYVELSENTSNAADATVPLSETCRATTFDGQINFEAVQGVLPDGRDLNIDFFAPAVQGASVKLEDGYDFAAHEGAAASYMDSVGVWNADSGTVTIESVSGETYVVKLENVHFAVLPGQPVEPTAMGEFVANGRITATAMPGGQ